MRTPDPDDPGAPVHDPLPGPPPSPDDVRGMLAGVIDPELHASIVDLGMVDDVRVGPDGGVMVEGRPDHRRVPAAGADPPGRRVEGARPPRRHRGEGRVRRDDP